MPKAPVLSRTLLWQTLSDGTVHLVDWCLVSTSLGLMVEPRLVDRPTGSGIQDEDWTDSSYSGISMLPASPSGHYALDQLTQGAQWPHYRATDPGVN